MLELIIKKRDGLALSKLEINELISGLVNEDIPDYQISAFLMAVYFKGMNSEETEWLTEAIMESGEIVDLSEIEGVIVDKHSTGGVGDKTTLIVAPLIAAAGVPVAKMSGRGLGHTGGTIDKLESVPGFRVSMSSKEFVNKVKMHKIAICGQSKNLVPADKKLYSLRDVTGTVDNLALITSSIMSKKLACGASAIVLDIKLGVGAYMKTIEKAEALAKLMLETGKRLGRTVRVVISAMDQPLGNAIGNALEIKEAILVLKGKGPKDLIELSLTLGAQMLMLAGKFKNMEPAKEHLRGLIKDGSAFEKFTTFIQSQGGDIQSIKNPDLLPDAKYKVELLSDCDGTISFLNAHELGHASVLLGAGRENKNSVLELGAGLLLNKKIGDSVKKNDLLVTMFANNRDKIEKAKEHVLKAYQFGEEINLKPLIIKIIK